MINKIGTQIYFAVLAADLAAVHFNMKIAEYIFKPMIVLLLLVLFIKQTREVTHRSKAFILAALLFCWLGDIVLMLQAELSFFFLAGLSAFLVGHILYSLFFRVAIRSERIKLRWILFLIVAAYCILLLAILSPGLGDLRWPVYIYGIVISLMLALALHLPSGRSTVSGRYIVAGAILFVLSDSILAVNRFYQPFSMAGLLIMFTYGLSQFLLVQGAAGYLSTAHKE